MSAIVGAFHGNGQPIEPHLLERMLLTTPMRCVDGIHTWSENQVGLGYGLFKTRPVEAGVQPFVDGNLVIAASARIDNRDELATALRINGRSTSDAALILGAYKRWGEDCPIRLLGDFAFVIWDASRQVLFCARDCFGVRPFYYWDNRGTFLFASDMKALFAVGGVSRQQNDIWIADFLAGFTADEHSTPYKGVFRLPPRHTLSVSARGRQFREYWRAQPAGISEEASYPERFREIFTAAVSCRATGTPSLATALSGGLDSSSITCVAAPIFAADRGQCLPTLSLVFDKTPALSERQFIEAVLAQGGYDPTFIPVDNHPAFANFGELLLEQDGPFLAPGLGFRRELFSTAAQKGIRVVLDGHGGDEVVSHGYGRLQELARDGRWIALWREAKGAARLYDQRSWQFLLRQVSKHYGLSRLLGRISRRIRGPVREGSGADALTSMVNPDLAARTDLVERYRNYRKGMAAASADEQTMHAWSINSPLRSYGFEVLDRTSAARGIELRYPFWDRRLVEFCLALPSDQKLDRGWTRLVLRRAMGGILPPSIQWRTSKLDFSPHVIRGMLLHHRKLMDQVFIDDLDDVGEVANLPVVRATYARLLDRAEAIGGPDLQTVWRTVTLAMWFRMARGPHANAH